MCAIDRLGPLRQDERDAVAARHAERGERVRQAVRLLLQVPVRQRAPLAGFVFPVEREARAVGGPAAAARVRDVEVGGHVPAVAVVELGVTVDGHGAGSLHQRDAAMRNSTTNTPALTAFVAPKGGASIPWGGPAGD